jgi:hypothetical protein
LFVQFGISKALDSQFLVDQYKASVCFLERDFSVFYKNFYRTASREKHKEADAKNRRKF